MCHKLHGWLSLCSPLPLLTSSPHFPPLTSLSVALHTRRGADHTFTAFLLVRADSLVARVVSGLSECMCCRLLCIGQSLAIQRRAQGTGYSEAARLRGDCVRIQRSSRRQPPPHCCCLLPAACCLLPTPAARCPRCLLPTPAARCLLPPLRLVESVGLQVQSPACCMLPLLLLGECVALQVTTDKSTTRRLSGPGILVTAHEPYSLCDICSELTLGACCLVSVTGASLSSLPSHSPAPSTAVLVSRLPPCITVASLLHCLPPG